MVKKKRAISKNDFIVYGFDEANVFPTLESWNFC